MYEYTNSILFKIYHSKEKETSSETKARESNSIK